MVNLGLNGRKRVHIRDSIDAVEQIVRVGGQALLVYVGFQTIGLFFGYAVSFGLAVVLASIYHLRRLSLSLTIPSKSHFYSLYRFSRYAWLGNFKSRALSWTDITILGLFVANSDVGVYQVSWTLSMTFQILGQSIGRNVFPEISDKASSGDSTQVASLANKSFVFAGLLTIPGIVGAILLGEQVLGIYGDEFSSGASLLVVLTGVSLLRSYEGTVSALAQGVNKPKITFLSDSIFIVSNVVLNFVLIYFFGALGAAVATFISLFLSIFITFQMVQNYVDFGLPTFELGIQIGAALVMGMIVWVVKSQFAALSFLNLLFVILFGATVYSVLVLVFSSQIRNVLHRILLSLSE
jgi:O-antigen/teichoic acid export membrane protein